MKHSARFAGGTVLTRDRLERKEEGGSKSAGEVKKVIDNFMSAFEEFKDTNDARLKELEKKGGNDPLYDEKLARMEESFDEMEELNKKMVQEEAKRQEELDELKATIEELETAMKRSPQQTADEIKAANNEAWTRGVVTANIQGILNLPDEQKAVIDAVANEWKALNVSTATAGGYLAPMEYVREIIKGVTEMSPVRSLARVRQTGMKTLEIPKRTGQFAAQWVAENGTKSETTGLTYGLEEIPTHEFYALIDISNQMMEDSVFNMSSEISMESSEQFAVAEGAAFVSGNGVGKPEGFLSNGSLATTNTGAATAITADGLISLKYSLKAAYTANATWLMNRTTMGSVRKLKDGNGQYLWMPGIAAGKPNTIDGDPYAEVTDMPDEGAGNKPVAYGDWRRGYTWVDRIQMEMLRDPYTQATSGNTRFIMRKRVGGQLTLAEAVAANVCSA